MVHGVVAPAVSLLADSIKHFRVPFYVLSYAEKSGFVALFCEHIQDPRGPLRMGTIIESQVHIAQPTLPCPTEFWKHGGDSRRDTGGVHGCNFRHKSHT